MKIHILFAKNRNHMRNLCNKQGIIFLITLTLLICGCSKDDNLTGPSTNSDTLAAAELREYFKAGVICTTGNSWDMAINGTAFFAMKKDDEFFFLRKPGSFFLDKNGQPIKEFNGPTLLGWPIFNRDTVDTFQFEKAIPIKIQPINTISKPKATTEVSFKGNINGDKEGLGTILYTQPFFHRADEFNTLSLGAQSSNDNNYGVYSVATSAHSAASLTFADIATDQGVIGSTNLTSIYNSKGENLLIKIGDVMKVTATINDGMNDETITGSFLVIEDPLQAGIVGGSTTDYRVSTIQQLLLAMEHFLTGSSWRGGAGSNASDAHVAIMPDGQVRVANNAGSSQSIRNLTVSSDRPISRTYVSSAFSFQSDIAVGSYSDASSRLFRPAKLTDNLFNPMTYDNAGVSLSGPPVAQIFTAKGDLIDLEQGDKLQISALIGKVSRNGSTFQTDVGTDVGTSTTMKEITTYIQDVLNLPERDGTIENNFSVSVNSARIEYYLIPEGAIVLRGQPETAFSINIFNLQATNSNPTTAAPSAFNSNMVVTQLQEARDRRIINVPFTVYDKIGAAHVLTLRLTGTDQNQPSVWLWQILTSSGDSLFYGSHDEIIFATDGSPSSFGKISLSNQIKFLNANNRNDTVQFTIKWGKPGSFEGIYQFYSPTTIAVDSVDGYPAGLLERYSINTKGLISGNFDNGQTYPLWQIALCNFPCREGLRSVGSGYFFKTELSGEPIFGNVGKTLRSVLISGAIEK
ncbi:MAG: flagellar hook-basal body complex protein [Fibrobacteres bacterium]|nr:flagellar hook-basal body complex protein [Fibrobacterota bacterium]